ncbi:ROK family protein [Nocardia callitridis]|uniref:ROK family protein n=1 Tax=Nocardia callitridis TaxID=648753 RepID=A0ABP9KNE6_9NOCA
MTTLALEIGTKGFAASRIEDDDPDSVRRIALPTSDAWARCRDLLLETARGDQVTGVGIGSIGPIDMPAGVVAPSEIAQWRTGFAIVEAVGKVFPSASVQLGFAGVCQALAERNFGMTTEVMDSLSLIVSDRISAGVMVGGFVAVGRTGNGGHIGHMIAPGFDDQCECGGRGCLEAVAGAASVVRWAREQGWQATTSAELIASAATGDQVARAALGRAGTALGRVIASVAALLDLDRVVVGGDLAQAGPALWQPLNEAVATHARLSFLPGLRVVPSQLGDLGVLAGAGVLGLSAQG